ncbi:MAG: hypothetical protein HXL29_01110 [Prevotellaceae bacterium]|nr:hypothetical protein [Prevotellaceae bacterium]
MRTTKFIPLLALVVFLTCSLPAFSAAPEEKPAADGVQTLYIYGVSQNQYADQFKDFVQQHFSAPHQTAAVFFDTRIETAEKRREKLRKQLAGSTSGWTTLVVKDVYKDQFVFKPIGR